MTLFDAPPAPPLTWIQRDTLRHAAYWEEMAREQTNSPRGRAFAEDAFATARRLRKEASDEVLPVPEL